MSIEINKSDSRLEAPSVTLSGKVIDETTGLYADTSSTARSSLETVVDGTTVTKQSVLNFYGDVTITLTPDSKFDANSYTNRESGDIIGATAVSDNKVGLKSETYYTVNGKDPSRTKSNLYTGAFIVKHNKSGSDNFVLKARTYCQGKESPVMKVEFKINRADSSVV